MPFDSVDDLKASDLYKRMGSLQQMGSAKLARFVAVFNSVVARATRGGAAPDEAESRAIPIALVAARKATAVPVGRTAESAEAVFSLFASEMDWSGSHIVGADVDMQFPDIEDVNDVMAGQLFFGPEMHDRDFAEPQGIIRRVATRDDLSEEVRDMVDPEIKIAAVVSFFDDVPEEERHATISPEWLTFKSKDSELHVPYSFITTANPANDQVMGIGRVAETIDLSAKPYQVSETLNNPGMHMPDDKPTVEELQKQASSLESELEEKTAELGKFKDLETKHDALMKEHADLQQKVASLSGETPEDPESVDTDAVIKDASEKIATLSNTVDDLVATQKQATADAWADDLFEKKQIATDARDTWAALHLENSENAEKLAATLPDRVLAPGEVHAQTSTPAIEGKEAEAYREDMDALYGEVKA